MFATIIKTNTVESQINALLHRLNSENKYACLELIMSLDAEERLPFLNRFVAIVAVIEDDFDEGVIEYKFAA